jgi:hypothetical protein
LLPAGGVAPPAPVPAPPVPADAPPDPGPEPPPVPAATPPLPPAGGPSVPEPVDPGEVAHEHRAKARIATGTGSAALRVLDVDIPSIFTSRRSKLNLR